MNERLNGQLLDISEHSYDHFSITVNHAPNRWLFLVTCAASTLPFLPSAASTSSLAQYRFRMAFMSSDDVHFVVFHFTAQRDWLFQILDSLIEPSTEATMSAFYTSVLCKE